MQHGVYKAEGLPVLPAQQAVGQSSVVFSEGSGTKKCLEDFRGFFRHPRVCLAMLTLEVKEDVELKFLNWEKIKYY